MDDPLPLPKLSLEATLGSDAWELDSSSATLGSVVLFGRDSSVSVIVLEARASSSVKPLRPAATASNCGERRSPG